MAAVKISDQGRRQYIIGVGNDVVRRIGKFEVVMDSKDREAIPFDRAAALTLVGELDDDESVNKDGWTEKFVSDVGTKLESGITLSGRQMFKLVEIHSRHIA